MAIGGSRHSCDGAGLLVDSALARAMYRAFHHCRDCAEEFCVAPVLTLEHGRLRRLGWSQLLYAARSVAAENLLSLLEVTVTR